MNNNNISAGTIARTVILLCALANQALTAAGHSPLPLDDEQITQGVALIWTVAASLAAWWKNNSFTRAAREADAHMQARRREMTR